MPNSRRLGVAILAVATLSSAARGDINVTFGEMDLFTNGVCGRRGSSTPTLGDDPGPANATAGRITGVGHVEGGPIGPGDNIEILPGTDGRISSTSLGTLAFVGDATRLRIDASVLDIGILRNMDGGSYAANAQGTIEYHFTVTTATAYTFSGVAAFDDEDIVGSILLSGPGAAHFIYQGLNGSFSFTGTLTPGDYTFDSGAYIASGAAGAPGFGDFTETSSFHATLLLGTPCDSGDLPALNAQPQDTSACPSAGAAFSVAATGAGPFAYEWQIELPPPSPAGLWTTLGTTPVPFDCGGSAQTSPADAATTSIEVVPCVGIDAYPIRCVVSSGCGSVTSDPATLEISLHEGDFNGNGIVDLPDFELLEPCLAGPASAPDVGCIPEVFLAADFNDNGNLDLKDFAEFQWRFGDTCP